MKELALSWAMAARLLCLCGALLCLAGPAQAGAYDPLAVAGAVETLDLNITAAQRRRSVPVRVFLPAGNTAAALVLFSHGLGGSREGNDFLGRHWARRGYVVVFLQHPGSDDGVWKDVAAAQRMAAMRAAASGHNFFLRVQDVSAVIDQLERWNLSAGSRLMGRLDLTRIGMSGHSFGALTTQAISGQTYGGKSVADPRIKAAIAFSPSSPRRGNAKEAFGKVQIPWLLMTGTHDTAVIGDADLASRLAVFPALPAGGKYELVLDGAEHSAFTDRALPGDSKRRNPRHHRTLLALSTAFWDAWLRDDAAAKAWLDGNGPTTFLDSKDRWQQK